MKLFSLATIIASIVGGLFGVTSASAQITSNVSFAGNATYSLSADFSRVTFSVASIQNRSSFRTGSMRIELWAFQDRYESYGTTLTGTQMARISVNPLNANSSFNNVTSGSLPVTLPPSGFWRLYLVLSEFTNDARNDGYVVVDHALLDQLLNQPGGNGQLANLSVRTNGGSGANTLIMGFVVGGGASKDILVRSVGPTLGAFGLTGVMADPLLQIFNSGGRELVNNDNWGGTATLRTTFNRLGAFALPDTSRDAAIFGTFSPGSYTAQTSSPNSGVALVELYDGGGTAAIQNGSVRAVAGSGDGTLIVGFSIVGQPRTVIIRAVGPTLGAFGLTGTISDPVLKLYRGADLLYTNDDWASTDNLYTAAKIQSTADAVGAFRLPSSSLDAVILVTLQPGTYSATVSGANGQTGVALLEFYTATL